MSTNKVFKPTGKYLPGSENVTRCSALSISLKLPRIRKNLRAFEHGYAYATRPGPTELDSVVVAEVQAYMPGGAGVQSGESAIERAHVVTLAVEMEGRPMLPERCGVYVCVLCMCVYL
jgi:hypothetical protein